MLTFIGDYTCKIDAKGRVLLPSAFKKHLPSEYQDRFVIKKDIFEHCLVLYPMNEWERQNKLIRSRINPYNKEHNAFLRNFYRGTAEISLDSNNRMLIPKRLLEFAEIGREVILAGQFGKIEIWSGENYERSGKQVKDFPALAEKLLGGSINDSDEE